MEELSRKYKDMTNKNKLSRGPVAGTGEVLRRLGQIALDYYEACNCVSEARSIMERAKSQWLAEAQIDTPAYGTDTWNQMASATTAEYEHLTRMKTRRAYVQDRLLTRAGAALGLGGKRRSDEVSGDVPKKMALLDLQQKLADPKQQRALDKRRLCAALSDAGVSRSVSLQICRDYFGPPPTAAQ